jgi:predicted nucleic acid-binding protein
LFRVWELRHNVSAYHAAYVALAEALGCNLVTADQRLATASGPSCTIEIVPR